MTTQGNAVQPSGRVLEALDPNRPVMRFVFKAPIVLWRLGLGFAVGQMFILMTHTGRKSGLPRRTMTEYHQAANGHKYVPCALGPKSQWYKNMIADPLVTIQTAQGVESARARRVTADDELLLAYETMHRRNGAMLGWYLESVGVADNAEAVLASKDRLYFMTFDPTDEATPPPLEADLKWVWGLLAGLLVLVGLLRRRR